MAHGKGYISSFARDILISTRPYICRIIDSDHSYLGPDDLNSVSQSEHEHDSSSNQWTNGGQGGKQ